RTEAAPFPYRIVSPVNSTGMSYQNHATQPFVGKERVMHRVRRMIQAFDLIARSRKGQMIATADLCIMIPCTILCFFFLTNTGLSVYYKNKLSFVADQTVLYTAAHLSGMSNSNEVVAFATEMFKKMNVPASNITVKVVKGTINNTPTLGITLTADFDLIQGSPLPYKIRLAETTLTANEIVGQVAVKVFSGQTMQTVYLPAGRKLLGTRTFSNDRFYLTDDGSNY
ncbi:MAG: hypothetical protein ACRD3W_31940, partial [Terriglobales bacterium]